MSYNLDSGQLLYSANLNIEKNIDLLANIDVGLCAQNILSQTRNLVESLALIVCEKNNIDLSAFDNKNTIAISRVKNLGSHYKDIIELHLFIETVASHFTLNEWHSYDLLVSYSDLLFNIKSFAKSEFDIEILRNIDKFPFSHDTNEDNFYTNLAKTINENPSNNETFPYTFYIERKRRIYTKNLVFYEYVISPARDNATKFDRTTCYSVENINKDHPLVLTFDVKKTPLFNDEIDIKIIRSYKTSIRPIELTNLSYIINFNKSFKRSSKGYNIIMNFLTNKKISLYDALMKDYYFKEFDAQIDDCFLKQMLLRCRQLIIDKIKGFKILTYLLCSLKNKVLKDVYTNDEKKISNNLSIHKGCLMFEEKPFCLDLKYHSTLLEILFHCLSEYCTDDQLLQRYISNNCDLNNSLYSEIDDLDANYDTNNLVEKYNKSCSIFTEKTQIIKRRKGKHLTIKCTEDEVKSIIECLSYYCNKPYVDYRTNLQAKISQIDQLTDIDDIKKNILKNAFSNSSLLIVKGPAGTGKTTILKYLYEVISDKKILFTTNTYSALHNIERRVGANNGLTCKYLVSSTLKNKGEDFLSNFDVLVIDECSTLRNIDVLSILSKHHFKALVLIGDDYQIESIKFGNWFGLLNHFFKSNVVELLDTFRTTVSNLKNLWSEVRNNDFKQLDGHLGVANFVDQLSDEVFERKEEQIVLCLNYDGLYGINNVNKYMQNKNDKHGVSWNVWTFKVEDPVLFTDSYNFSSHFYSNQKGVITNIVENDEKIVFRVKVDRAQDTPIYDGNYVRVVNYDKKFVEYDIIVDKKDTTDDEDAAEKPNFIVPFQLAYAISIHKSQGLEYDNVKIIISKEIEESISYNVFYTAITRARKNLKIYSDNASLRKTIEGFKIPSFKKDADTLYYENKDFFDSLGIVYS